MMRVAALTGGRRVPSARFRVAQYVAPLAALGVELREFPAALGSYPPRTSWARPAWLAGTLLDRIPAVLQSHRFDVTLIQRELVSTLRTFESLTGRPRVLDIDDAVWLLRDGKFIDRIAARCDLVLCGNDYLAEHFRAVNGAIRVLPTPVDTDRYAPIGREGPAKTPTVIGWTGTSGGFRYLYQIEDALTRVLKRHPDVRLRVISDRSPSFSHIPPDRLEFVLWRPESEVQAVQDMSIGLMPLADSPWERGKCSYKMLLYMACAIPVVVSPVGMNAEVMRLGKIGHAARTPEDWVSALLSLLEDPDGARAMGMEARRVVEERFSLRQLAPQLERHLRDVAA